MSGTQKIEISLCVMASLVKILLQIQLLILVVKEFSMFLRILDVRYPKNRNKFVCDGIFSEDFVTNLVARSSGKRI